MQAQLENQLLQQQLQQQLVQLQHVAGQTRIGQLNGIGGENPFLFPNATPADQHQHLTSLILAQQQNQQRPPHPHAQPMPHNQFVPNGGVLTPSSSVSGGSVVPAGGRPRAPSHASIGDVSSLADADATTPTLVDEPTKWIVSVQLKAGDKTWNAREATVLLSTTFADLLYLTTNIRAYIGLAIGDDKDAHRSFSPDTRLCDHPIISQSASSCFASSPGARVAKLGVTLSYDLGPNIKSCTRLGCPRLLLKKASRRACDHCQTHGFDLTARQVRVLHLHAPLLTPSGKAWLDGQVAQAQAGHTVFDPNYPDDLTRQLLSGRNHSELLGQILDRALGRIEHWKFESSDPGQVFLAFASEAHAEQAQIAFEKIERAQFSSPAVGVSDGRSRSASKIANRVVLSPSDSLPSVGLSSPVGGGDSDSEAPRHRTRSAGRQERGRAVTAGGATGTGHAIGQTTASGSSRSSAQTASHGHSKSHSHSGHSRSSSRSVGDLHAGGMDTDLDAMGILGDGIAPVTSSPTVPNPGVSGPHAAHVVSSLAPTHVSLCSHMAHPPVGFAYTVRMKSHFWKLEVRALHNGSNTGGKGGIGAVTLFKKLGKPNQKRGHGPEPPLSTAGRILGLGRQPRRRALKSEVDVSEIGASVLGGGAGVDDDLLDKACDDDDLGVDVDDDDRAHPPMDLVGGTSVGVKLEDLSGSKARSATGKRRHDQITSPHIAQTNTNTPEELSPPTTSIPFSSPPSTTSTGSSPGTEGKLRKFDVVDGIVSKVTSPTLLDHGRLPPIAHPSSQVLVSSGDFARMKHRAVPATMQVRAFDAASTASSIDGHQLTTHDTPVLLIYRDRKQLHRDLAHGYLGDAPSSDDGGDDSGSDHRGGPGSGGGGGGGGGRRGGDSGDGDDNGDDSSGGNKRRKVDTHGASQFGGQFGESHSQFTRLSTGPFLAVPTGVRSPTSGRPRVSSLLQEEKSISPDSSGSDSGDHRISLSSSAALTSRSQHPPSWRNAAPQSPASPGSGDAAIALDLASAEYANREREKHDEIVRQADEDEMKQMAKSKQTPYDESITLPDWMQQPVAGAKLWRMCFAFGWGPVIAFTLLFLLGVVALVFLGANISSGGGLAPLASTANLASLHLFTYGKDTSLQAALDVQRAAMVRSLVDKMRASSAAFNLWTLQIEQPIVIAATTVNTLEAAHTDARHTSLRLMREMRPLSVNTQLLGNSTGLIRNATVSQAALLQLQNISYISRRCAEVTQSSLALGNWLLYSSDLGSKATLVPYGQQQSVYSTTPQEFCRRMDHMAGRQILYRMLCTSMGANTKVRPYCALGDVSGFSGESCTGIVQFLYSNNLTSAAFQWPYVDRSTPALTTLTEANAIRVSNAYATQAEILGTQCSYFTAMMQTQQSESDLASMQQTPTVQMDSTVLAVLLFGAVGMVLIGITIILAIVWFVQSRFRSSTPPPPLSAYTAHRYRAPTQAQEKDNQMTPSIRPSSNADAPSPTPTDSVLPLRPLTPIPSMHRHDAPFSSSPPQYQYQYHAQPQIEIELTGV